MYHESPIFDGKLIYAELNPTWTIPRSIAIKETLPKLISDPNYLREKNMILMDVSGNQIDPLTIDFSQLTQSNFPYTVRQNPGPHNALGQVKFIFPNKYSVYVHDTPVRSLFSMENRAFSHGCIRIERKWELFLNIMGDDWSQDRIDKVLKSGETTRVNLKNPLPILLLYWTAGADKYGDIFFDKDVYDRDPEVLEKLNLPVLFKTLSN